MLYFIQFYKKYLPNLLEVNWFLQWWSLWVWIIFRTLNPHTYLHGNFKCCEIPDICLEILNYELGDIWGKNVWLNWLENFWLSRIWEYNRIHGIKRLFFKLFFFNIWIYFVLWIDVLSSTLTVWFSMWPNI